MDCSVFSYLQQLHAKLDFSNQDNIDLYEFTLSSLESPKLLCALEITEDFLLTGDCEGGNDLCVWNNSQPPTQTIIRM